MTPPPGDAPTGAEPTSDPSTVDAPTVDAPTAADAVFDALADPTRRGVLRDLGRRGEATATELAAAVTVSRQAVTKHLQVLEAAGLVGAERHGRERRYRVTPAPLDDAVRWMTEVGAAWDDRLDRLRHTLDDD